MGSLKGGHRIGLVGCGHWGRHILRDLVSLGCAVTVVARSQASRARAEAGNAKAVVPDLDSLAGVDGLVVASSTVHHAEIVERLIPRGVPLFVEKPLTANAEDAERIAANAPDQVFVMDKWRYHPGVEALAGLARSGELGPVQAVETVRIGWGNPHHDVDGVWHLAPHDLSIITHILGRLPPPRAARADLADGVPAGIVGLLGDDGPWASLSVHTRSSVRVRRVTLRCEEGVASLADGYADCIDVLKGYPTGDRMPEPEERPISTELPLLRELRAFLSHLDGGPPPMSSAADGAATCRAIHTLRQLAGIEA